MTEITASAPRNLSPGTVAADGLLHPAVLVAIGLLLLNDHVLKAFMPGPLTGKLSDFAGLAFFPLLLIGAWEVTAATARRWPGPRARPLIAAIVVTALGFTWVKMTIDGSVAFGWVIGTVGWLAASVTSWLLAAPAPIHARSVVVADPTDLMALAALGVPMVVGWRRVRAGRTRTVQP